MKNVIKLKGEIISVNILNNVKQSFNTKKTYYFQIKKNHRLQADIWHRQSRQRHTDANRQLNRQLALLRFRLEISSGLELISIRLPEV